MLKLIGLSTTHRTKHISAHYKSVTGLPDEAMIYTTAIGAYMSLVKSQICQPSSSPMQAFSSCGIIQRQVRNTR